MALPEDHLTKFHKMTDAKEMWDAIKSRFGGNDESKKMQKYILKQQFKGFSVSNSEGLHKGYDKFQSLLSQLEIHGAGVSTEDANQKFLRSLPSSWSQVSLVMRTKPGVDSLSFDNLTNDVSTAYGVSTSSGYNSQRENSSSYTDELMYSFVANQSRGTHLDHEDLEQLDEFDLEEIDLKWQVAMISMRLKKFYKKTCKRLQFDAKELIGFDKTKVECYNCHNTGQFAKECRSKGNQDSRRRDAGNTGYRAKDNGRRPGKQEEPKALVTLDGEGVDWTGHAEDEQENFVLMASHSPPLLETFNFSKFIFDAMVKNLDNPHKFLMYPRFIQICLNKQRRLLQPHTRSYHTPVLTQKVFSNMKRVIRGYSGDDIPLFSSMITAPETSPSRITSSPSLSPQPTPVSAPSTSPPPIPKTTPTAEEPAPMPHESPLQSVHSLGCDEGSVPLNELMALVTQLTNKVRSLENELMNTKKVYGSAITKLVNRVKKLDKQIKTGTTKSGTKIVLSEDEAIEEDSSKQGRSLIEELDMDADFSLVPPHDAEIQEKISDDTKVLLEEEEPTELVEDQGSGEKGNKRRSAKKKKDKGKEIVIEDEFVQKKSKKQVQEERLGYEEAIRLQEQIDKEERKRIARDAEIAKQLQEEYDKVGKKEAVFEVDIAHVIDWDDLAVIRYHALQNRPRYVAEVRKNMMVYLKNQGGYKMKDFKGMRYDDIRPIFEKVWDQIHSFVPMDSEEEVQILKRAGQDVEAKPAKRQRTKEVSESVQEQTDEDPKTDELS
ncbi:hypothetical protein Tco_0450432 [Tanacetum coccineum]